MRLGIVRVFKLPGVESVGIIGNLARLAQGAVDALLRRNQDDLAAVGPDGQLPLPAHALGHDGDEFESHLGAGHCQGDAGRAAGGLDDGAALLDFSVAPGLLDHIAGDAVLGRAAGIEEFELAPDAGPSRLEAHLAQRSGLDFLDESSFALEWIAHLICGGREASPRPSLNDDIAEGVQLSVVAALHIDNLRISAG